MQATTFSGGSADVSSRHRSQSHRSSRPRVLVVEDERDIAELVKHTLERGGDIDVEISSSGDAALKGATENPPDLILLDLNLPVVSGLEVCRLLRGRPATNIHSS